MNSYSHVVSNNISGTVQAHIIDIHLTEFRMEKAALNQGQRDFNGHAAEELDRVSK